MNFTTHSNKLNFRILILSLFSLFLKDIEAQTIISDSIPQYRWVQLMLNPGRITLKLNEHLKHIITTISLKKELGLNLSNVGNKESSIILMILDMLFGTTNK